MDLEIRMMSAHVSSERDNIVRDYLRGHRLRYFEDHHRPAVAFDRPGYSVTAVLMHDEEEAGNLRMRYAEYVWDTTAPFFQSDK